jgi:23S rRNA pseudouridine2605 synthase
MRLNKFLAQAGIASRRKGETLISEGRVKINGRPAEHPAQDVDPDIDIVKVDGRSIFSVEQRVYVILNKPRGIVTTSKDEKDRKTVVDMIHIRERVFPVGRLDMDSTGLILLTNDGELAYLLSHPKFEISKKYMVTIRGKVAASVFDDMRQGIELEGKHTRPAEIREIGYRNGKTAIHMSIHEGWNRQIRRMFAKYNHLVIGIDRIEYAGMSLRGLPRGRWRFLKADEIRDLFRLADKHRAILEEKNL